MFVRFDDYNIKLVDADVILHRLHFTVIYGMLHYNKLVDFDVILHRLHFTVFCGL